MELILETIGCRPQGLNDTTFQAERINKSRQDKNITLDSVWRKIKHKDWM